MKYTEVILMMIEFRFKNYRSFRDDAVLSMEATGLSSFKSCLIPLTSTVKLLPAIAIYGKNGGGKSNVIQSFLVGCAVYPKRTENAARACCYS